MKRFIPIAVLMIAGTAHGQTVGTSAVGQSAADAGAIASTGAITFEAAEQRRHQSVSTTPPVYIAPSMFGGSNNCMASDTFGASVTGLGVGGSRSKESINCNTREDTAIWANLGLMDVAKLRFACFGADENRKAYEAAGHVCPSSGTAEGIDGAPVGPAFAVAPQMPETVRMRIRPDGSVETVR